MRAKDHRRAIPMGVKLDACLLLLGFTKEQIAGGEIQWDHDPALGLRSVVDGEIKPASNDPAFIRPMVKAGHDLKTRGAGATTAGSDVGKISKLRRIEKDPPGGEEFRRKLLAVKAGEPPAPTKKPKHKWASRPFPTKRKKP